MLRTHGKWVLHPGQIEAANQAFAPTAADYARAVAIIEALCTRHHG